MVLLRILKWMIIAAIAVIVGFAVMLLGGSQLSLDRDYTHTQETAALPAFTPIGGSGLVTISANGHQFRARIAGFDGNDEKPAVMLLHGFPVTSAMWVDLIQPLEDAGYRVVAFDQRGYSPGARPEDISEYTIDKLSADVIAVADATGMDRFHLIGHDWGAGVGWSIVLGQPTRLLSWTGLSIAHPAAFTDALANDPDQQARSSYFLFFRTPLLPETVFTFNGLQILMSFYGEMSRLQRDEYFSVFSEPGALTSGLNWYRAMNQSLTGGDEIESDVSIPTLFIWGNNDGAVGRVAVESMAQYMKGPYLEIELDAGHWLMVDYPAEVTDAVLDHLAAFSRTP